jgi:NAD-dependent dihydropyrimidine dehydrogenase PreA subunit
MKIEQTKCDHCGKVHETPNRYGLLFTEKKLLSVPLEVSGSEANGKSRRQLNDFCDEKCLREYLVKRSEQDEETID